MADHGDEVIADEDFADCYSSGVGRPSIPPSLLMKAVLLQVRDDGSDREAARRAAKDLDWKRALGLDADEVPFHHTTLSAFRSRLMVNDADERVLRATVQPTVEVGLFPEKVLGGGAVRRACQRRGAMEHAVGHVGERQVYWGYQGPSRT